MALINTGSIALLLRPGINKIFGMSYNRFPDQYKEIYNTQSSNMQFERDVIYRGFREGLVKPEGEPVTFDQIQQVRDVVYKHVVYALGFIVTREALKYNLYMKSAQEQVNALAVSMKQTKEMVAINLLNKAFSSAAADLQSDGKSLIATDNPLGMGGTWSNRAASDSDFNQAAFESAIIQIKSSYYDEAGLRISPMPRKLIIPPGLEFDVSRVVGSQLQSDTAENAINVVKNIMPYSINNFLSDPDAWFILTNQDGLRHYQATPYTVSNETDFNTDNLKYKCLEEYSFGCSDKRAIWGNAGG